MQVQHWFKTFQMDLPSLIREVCQRQGSCEILDLGSGVPHTGGSYGSFRHTAAARADGLLVSLTAVDVIWPPMSRFLVGESYFTPDYDFPGVAAALNGQGVECVGEDFNAFIRKSVERVLLSVAEGTPRPEGAQPLPKKWDIILSRDTSLSLAFIEATPNATATDLRVLMNADGYILLDAPGPTVDYGSSFPSNVLSAALKSKIIFAEEWCRLLACRAIVSIHQRYVVLQATQQDGRFIETVVRQ